MLQFAVFHVPDPSRPSLLSWRFTDRSIRTLLQHRYSFLPREEKRVVPDIWVLSDYLGIHAYLRLTVLPPCLDLRILLVFVSLERQHVLFMGDSRFTG